MIKPILKPFTCMDLRQIADSGQCFRMTELSDVPGRFSVISQERYLEIEQLECDWKQTDETRFEAKTFAFYCKEEELSFWERYFDLDQDYEAYISSVRKRDSYLQHAAQAGSGIRILNQDPWEMILTFVISQQKTIPKIREAVEALSRRFGTEHRTAVLRGSQEKEITWHSFPPRPAGRSLRGDASRLKAWLPGQIHCPPLPGCGGGKAESGRPQNHGL